MKYYIWYLYFCMYWSAFNWGEKHNPQSNATNLLTLILILNISAVLQLLMYFGYSVSALSFIVICGIPALTIPYFLIQKAKSFKIRLTEFDFLSAKEFNRKSIITVVSVLLISMALNSGMAILRNLKAN